MKKQEQTKEKEKEKQTRRSRVKFSVFFFWNKTMKAIKSNEEKQTLRRHKMVN